MTPRTTPSGFPLPPDPPPASGRPAAMPLESIAPPRHGRAPKGLGMEIITPPEERPAFYLFAHPLTCPECGVVFRVRPGDEFRRVAGPDVALHCPYCRRALNVWRPKAEGEPPRVSAG